MRATGGVLKMSLPEKQGLYDPIHEHDACGVGFIANIKGRKSNEIIGRGLEILLNIDHRGAVGADPLVGDGAGILIQIPDELLRDWAEGAGVVLPQPGDYAVAMCFMPRDENARTVAVEQFSRFVRNEGQVLLGWRSEEHTSELQSLMRISYAVFCLKKKKKQK